MLNVAEGRWGERSVAGHLKPQTARLAADVSAAADGWRESHPKGRKGGKTPAAKTAAGKG